jgi:Holliday junction resolvasome RuvABC endonuclease subunit
MLVAGLDVDTKGGHYCLWDGQRATLWGDIQDASIFTEAGVDVVYVEQTPFVQNFQTMRALAEHVGRWQERLDNAGVRYVMIAVAEWKKRAVGNGGFNKGRVKQMIIATTNLPDGLNEHAYDACGIAVAGYGLEMLAATPSKNAPFV